MYYLYNGQYLKDEDKIKSSPLSDGVMYGYGLFETIRVSGLKPEYLEDHILRLKKGLDALQIRFTYSDEKIKEYALGLIRRNGFNGALKIAVIKNKNQSDLVMMMKNSVYHYHQYKKGFKVKISDVKRNSTSNIVKYKTINYLENLLEFKKAKEEGFDEVLFFNERGFLSEGGISNIFIVKNNNIMTPSLDQGLLNGIIRNRIVTDKRFNVREEKITMKMLKEADLIFLTNSLMRVMPVKEVEGVYKNTLGFDLINDLRQLI